MAALPTVHIYCDGACSPNPGTGGWGALLIAVAAPDHTRELFGAEPNTTNNRMELLAAIRALEWLKRPCEVVLHTDSTYLRNAFENGWLSRWQKNGWLTREQTPVANADLWGRLVELNAAHRITWTWVRGHDGNELHDRVDALAVRARKEYAAGLSANVTEPAMVRVEPA